MPVQSLAVNQIPVDPNTPLPAIDLPFQIDITRHGWKAAALPAF
jgi:hypothetical protein